MIHLDKKMRVSVFGVGSALDQILLQSVQMAVEELNLPVEIQEIRDINLFMEKGISAIPALAIEDQVIVNGRVPSVTEIKRLFGQYSTPDLPLIFP